MNFSKFVYICGPVHSIYVYCISSYFAAHSETNFQCNSFGISIAVVKYVLLNFAAAFRVITVLSTFKVLKLSAT
jgi:hypothetical protein